MPADAVNQTVLPAEYAVPIASFALWVHRGAMPGAPEACFTIWTLAMSFIDDLPQLSCRPASPAGRRDMTTCGPIRRQRCRSVGGGSGPSCVESRVRRVSCSRRPARRVEHADVLGDRCARIEDRCPRNRDRHAGVREGADVLGPDATIDLDLDVSEAATDELRP